MLATGEYQRARPELGTRLRGRAGGARRATASRRSAVEGCGRASTSTRRSATGRAVALRLLDRGVLAKDTHGQTLRLAPPLVVTEEELDWLVTQLRACL